MQEKKSVLDDHEFLTCSEVAELLRISKRMAQMLAKDQKLPAVQVGREWRFPTSQLRKMREGSWPGQSTSEKGAASGTSGIVTPAGSSYDDLLGQKTK